MASKWKYADLDAGHRIGLLRKGYKDVFNEEVARTREVTEARRALGLDTTEQEQWMDTVGYNYNLYLSDGSAPVSRTGYAKLYLYGKEPDTELSPVERNRRSNGITTTYFSDAKRRIEKARKLAKKSAEDRYAKLKENARKEHYKKYPHLWEQLLNEGASLEGGKVKRTYELIEKQLEDIYAEFDVKLKEELGEIDRRYTGIGNELIRHRDSGTARESFGVVVDVLLKNASKKDGYDYSLIPGISGSGKTYESSQELVRGYGDNAIVQADISGKKAAVRDNDAASAEDTAEDDSVTVEKEGSSGITDDIYNGVYDIADMVKNDPVKAAALVGRMFVAGGMSANRAATAAAELIGLLVRRSVGKS